MSDLPIPPFLEERFDVVRSLGRGGQGQTFLARDKESGAEVAIKQLLLSRAEDWKSIELFEREARVLRSLDHPGIPDFIETFNDEVCGGLFLVEEYVEGENLQDFIDSGQRFDEAEARHFLSEMLAILNYLHNFHPPVVHRDIKPANIIRQAEGHHRLVDFGAVKEAFTTHGTPGGSTMVGTAGFLPAEQLMGHAAAGSDLYALGVTVIYLMSGIQPVELPVHKMKLQFEEHVDASPDFLKILQALVEPDVEDRPKDAADALELLKSRSLQRSTRPKRTRIHLERSADSIRAVLPRQVFTKPVLMANAVLMLPVAGALIFAVRRMPLLIALVIVLFVMVALRFTRSLRRTTLILTPKSFRVEHELFGASWGKKVDRESFAGLRSVIVHEGTKMSKPLLRLDAEGAPYDFGDGLSAGEREWLIEEFRHERGDGNQ
ncbi:MAG: serine/threonine protein kinase [Bradymonadaceae bacterium]